jgi:hypothetical protein
MRSYICEGSPAAWEWRTKITVGAEESAIAKPHKSRDVAVRSPKSCEVRVRRTRLGKGVFARMPYRMDSVIGEIHGELIDGPDYGSDYCIDIEDGRLLEPAPPFRFLNHSCEPNCEFDFFDLPDETTSAIQRRVFLLALIDIANGDELTIDYNWAADAAIPCRCQAPTCRQWIVRASQLSDMSSILEARNS